MMESSIRELVEKYRGRLKARDDELNCYRNEVREVSEENIPAYDEDRSDNAYESEIDLFVLLEELEALIPPSEGK
ncbi:hypothetical protein OHB13_11965 [Streptomyces sp. NBC_00440]|uniref:hypothetical protein n=1 Tax=Streptomyces sp. NBC_00440 TaxID=2975741 RepID=UPI002E1E31C5